MKIALLLCLIMPALCFSQISIPKKDGKIFYEKVVSVDSVNKAQLYLNAKQWLSSVYKNSKNVIEIDDKDAGKLVSKGSINYSLNSGFKTATAYFTMAIDVKDGKYRFQIYDFSIKRSKRDFNGIDVYFNADLDKDLAEYESGKGSKADKNVFEFLNTFLESYIVDLDKRMSASGKDDF